MKKIITFLILIVCISCLCGCGKTEKTYNHGQFVLIEEKSSGLESILRIVYDKDTKVKYYYIVETYGQSIVPIYNPDGTLQTYEGE